MVGLWYTQLLSVNISAAAIGCRSVASVQCIAVMACLYSLGCREWARQGSCAEVKCVLGRHGSSTLMM